MLGRPLFFDFSGEPPEPDWLVDGLIERGTVTVLSADSGIGKSILCDGLAVAILKGETFLGRQTDGTKVMFIDEENHFRVVQARFYGWGLRNGETNRLRYFLRLGVRLGEGNWLERTLAELHDFEPDLLVLETASNILGVADVNDNTHVARLFQTAIRPLADICPVIVQHHERKPQHGGSNKRYGDGAEMLGARQWYGQADCHIELRREAPLSEHWTSNGTWRKRYRIAMTMPKSRDGAVVNERLVIVSDHRVDGRVESLRIVRPTPDERPL